MLGLPFDWNWTDHGLVVGGIGTDQAQHFATQLETALIRRVEELAEAAQRSELLLRMLPGRMNAAVDMEAAYRVLSSTLYEAEAALHYVLTGEEAVLNVSEPPMGGSEQDQSVSGENHGD